MPSSTITSSDKSKVKACIPSSTNKIITATVARVFVAHPNKSTWSYTGVEGALAFVRDLSRETFVLKVVDLKGAGGVLWEHELYEPLSYNQDRTFFHTLEGDDYLIGFAFADDTEASDLNKKIGNRQKFAKASSSKKKKTGSKLGGSKSNGKIDKSRIGAPTDFKHVAHMGFSAEKGFSTENVDPSWAALLTQLSDMGVSEKDIKKNEGFIKDFVGRRGGVPKPAAGAKAKKTPPPAPSRAPTSARKPPPPPAPRRTGGTAAAAAAPPAPPPPPARAPAASSAPAPPPPPPARGGAGVGAPPPPPPPPARGGGAAAAPPPPPPLPPISSGAPPPPPPPAPGAPPAPGLPPPQDGRSNLLASIQGKGVHSLRKADPSAAAAGGAAVGAGAGAGMAAASTPDEAGGGEGGDLAHALAAALSARKDNMGDSDDEESEEEW